MLGDVKGIEQAYERVMLGLEGFLRERFSYIREGLAKLYNGCNADELLLAMREDRATSEYAYHRVKEIVESSLAAERELCIDKLTRENALLRESQTVNEKKLAEAQSALKEKNAKHKAEAKEAAEVAATLIAESSTTVGEEAEKLRKAFEK